MEFSFPEGSLDSSVWLCFQLPVLFSPRLPLYIDDPDGEPTKHTVYGKCPHLNGPTSVVYDAGGSCGTPLLDNIHRLDRGGPFRVTLS